MAANFIDDVARPDLGPVDEVLDRLESRASTGLASGEAAIR